MQTQFSPEQLLDPGVNEAEKFSANACIAASVRQHVRLT